MGADRSKDFLVKSYTILFEEMVQFMGGSMPIFGPRAAHYLGHGQLGICPFGEISGIRGIAGIDFFTNGHGYDC